MREAVELEADVVLLLTHLPKLSPHPPFSLAQLRCGHTPPPRCALARVYNLSKIDFSNKAALFAFWLRSSVVSVLFSLISETSPRVTFYD